MPAKNIIVQEVAAGELARILGVGRRHIYELVKRGMPRDGRLFDLAACVQWQIQQVRPDESHEGENIQEQRLLLYREQTHKLALENGKLRRELVSLEEAKGVLLAIASVVAGQLDALGPRLAPVIAGRTDVGEIQDVIFAECREVRRSIADEIGRMDTTRPTGDQPAAGADGRPMGGSKKDPPRRKLRARAMANG